MHILYAYSDIYLHINCIFKRIFANFNAYLTYICIFLHFSAYINAPIPASPAPGCSCSAPASDITGLCKFFIDSNLPLQQGSSSCRL